jgi:hypothetical protein
MSLTEVSKLYSAKNIAGNAFAVKGYKVPKQAEKVSLSMRHVLTYPKELESKKKSFMN